jgi:hypothetical protein
VLRILIGAGFEGPLCVEKVPGVEDVDAVDANMAKACGYVKNFVRLAAGAADDGAPLAAL